MSKSNFIIFINEINTKRREPKPVKELPPRNINSL